MQSSIFCAARLSLLTFSTLRREHAAVSKHLNNDCWDVRVQHRVPLPTSTTIESRRRVRSVGELHIAHCSRLVAASKSMEKKVASVTWEWAALRACKLAENMTPRELSLCAATFAQAQHRNMRVFFMLGEEAIKKKGLFGPQAVATILSSYASVRIRNEPLFEAMSMKIAKLSLDEDAVKDAPKLNAKTLLLIVIAHVEISLTGLSMYPVLCSVLVPRVHELQPDLIIEALRILGNEDGGDSTSMLKAKLKQQLS